MVETYLTAFTYCGVGFGPYELLSGKHMYHRSFHLSRKTRKWGKKEVFFGGLKFGFCICCVVHSLIHGNTGSGRVGGVKDDGRTDGRTILLLSFLSFFTFSWHCTG